MTLYQTWLQLPDEDGDLQYAAAYHYCEEDESFDCKLTTDPDAAVSVITTGDDTSLLRQRLIEALLRKPEEDSPLATYYVVPKIFAALDRDGIVVSKPVPEIEAHKPNTTYQVEEVCVDYDEIGASHQIMRNDNRYIAPVNTAEKYCVLAAGFFVDAQTGTRYPGLVADSAEGPLFWEVPDELGPVIAGMHEEGEFPYLVKFQCPTKGRWLAAVAAHQEVTES